MLNDIVAHDIAQGISVPVSTTQNRLLPPWARITSRLRAHPTGLPLLISEQTFHEQACIRRKTLLREQRTYPLLDLSKRRRPQRKRLQSTLSAPPMTFESWLPMDSEVHKESNCNARAWSPYVEANKGKVADWSWPWVCGGCTSPRFAAN